MAKMYYQKYQNTNPESKGYQKWYARPVPKEVIDIDGMTAHIMEHGSVWTEDVVSGVLKKFRKCLVELIMDSKNVKIDGLGTFYVSFKSKGTDSADDLTANSITGAQLKFKVDQSAKANLTSKVLRGRMNIALDSMPIYTPDKPADGDGTDPSDGDGTGGNTNP